MAISSITIGAAGMHRASQQFEQSASRIARFGTGENVDIATELVNVMQAETDFKASAKVVGVAADLSKRLLDILA
jgi:flagellar hook protein FlgE